MKALRLLPLFLLAASAQASDTAEVLFQGQSSADLNLQTVLYRTEYQNRPVIRTCRQGGRTYPCTVWERVAVRVFDANVYARVHLSFGDVPVGMMPRETFVVSLNRDHVQVMAKTSGKLLITQANPFLRSVRIGDTIQVVGRHAFHFHDLFGVSATIENGITDVTVSQGKIFFALDSAFFNRGFLLNLAVSKNRFLARDSVYFSKIVQPDSLEGIPMPDGRTLYSADLVALGVPSFSKGRVNFDLTGMFNTEGETILNTRDLPRGGEMKGHIRMKAKDL